MVYKMGKGWLTGCGLHKYRHVSILFKGGLHHLPPKFEDIFVAVITFPPFFCADTLNTSLLLIVCALR